MYGHTEDAVGKAKKSIHRFPDANTDADDNDSSVRLSRNHLEGGWLADWRSLPADERYERGTEKEKEHERFDSWVAKTYSWLTRAGCDSGRQLLAL